MLFFSPFLQRQCFNTTDEYMLLEILLTGFSDMFSSLIGTSKEKESIPAHWPKELKCKVAQKEYMAQDVSPQLSLSATPLGIAQVFLHPVAN